MNQVFSTTSSTTASRTRHNRAASIALWTLQVLLALVFLLMGSMKLITPVEVMQAQMGIPGWFIQFIGIAEIAGGLGLILPMLFRVLPALTPLAAACLVVIMVGATIVTLLIGGGASALMPFVLGILLALVAYGRRDRFALTFKRREHASIAS